MPELPACRHVPRGVHPAVYRRAARRARMIALGAYAKALDEMLELVKFGRLPPEAIDQYSPSELSR